MPPSGLYFWKMAAFSPSSGSQRLLLAVSRLDGLEGEHVARVGGAGEGPRRGVGVHVVGGARRRLQSVEGAELRQGADERPALHGAERAVLGADVEHLGLAVLCQRGATLQLGRRLVGVGRRRGVERGLREGDELGQGGVRARRRPGRATTGSRSRRRPAGDHGSDHDGRDDDDDRDDCRDDLLALAVLAGRLFAHLRRLGRCFGPTALRHVIRPSAREPLELLPPVVVVATTLQTSQSQRSTHPREFRRVQESFGPTRRASPAQPASACLSHAEPGSATTLAADLVERDARRETGIERLDRRAHRDRDDLVAGLAHEPREPLALRTGDDDEGLGRQ